MHRTTVVVAAAATTMMTGATTPTLSTARASQRTRKASATTAASEDISPMNAQRRSRKRRYLRRPITKQPFCDEALSAQVKIRGGNVRNNHDLVI
jgi:hypothetical protein